MFSDGSNGSDRLKGGFWGANEDNGDETPAIFSVLSGNMMMHDPPVKNLEHLPPYLDCSCSSGSKFLRLILPISIGVGESLEGFGNEAWFSDFLG